MCLMWRPLVTLAYCKYIYVSFFQIWSFPSGSFFWSDFRSFSYFGLVIWQTKELLQKENYKTSDKTYFLFTLSLKVSSFMFLFIYKIYKWHSKIKIKIYDTDIRLSLSVLNYWFIIIIIMSSTNNIKDMQCPQNLFWSCNMLNINYKETKGV